MANATNDSKESEETSGRKTVFIIEDDVFLVNAYQIKFEKEGISVWIATDGKEAIEFLKKNPPDAILLDLMLPGTNGFDVLEIIRKNEKWKNVPVFVLTNLGQSYDMERCQKLGVSEYMVKANTKINDVVAKVKKTFL